jgi:hypothetical protein
MEFSPYDRWEIKEDEAYDADKICEFINSKTDTNVKHKTKDLKCKKWLIRLW